MTSDPHAIDAPSGSEPHTTGIWTLAGGRPIIAEPEGPATILVPTEQVRLLAVDLPLPSRAKRLEALPFAIEDLIAEPAESLHLALGAEIAPKRYLVGVVRHEVMARWVDLAEAGGLGDAAMVPDALALPQPPEGEWAVDLGETRALVRAGDGSGFAVPAPLLGAAWEAAGKPGVLAYGTALPPEMMLGRAALGPGPLAARLPAPSLDLRHGRYAVRRAGNAGFWNRLGGIVRIGPVRPPPTARADRRGPR
ncbi:type II secretion system protein GspL [Sphingomonas sp. dw_22]|uniref:type II secretion system protein GspL n=1 Tax=Sphingomonas sp. dw_22 TaxID=2721175 RepID=UPI0031FEB19C